jgi:hypothetical protein
MASPATIDEAIDRNARGPASVNVDGTTVSSKDISQLIEAARYQAGVQAAAYPLDPSCGIRYAQIQPPAAG